MTTWQRRVRLGLAVFVVVFAAGVFFALRQGAQKPQSLPITRSDPTAAVESTRGVAFQLRGEKQEFKVESEEALVYASGSRKLKRVKVTVENRGGRSFVLTGREADVGENQAAIVLTGDVALQVSDGLILTTDRATYTDTDGIVRAPGPVNFRRGRMTGSGVGMTYDKNSDVVWLLDQTVLDVTPDARSGGATHVTAHTVGLVRKDRQVRFEGGVRMIREGRALEASDAIAYLTDDENRIRRVELRGGSRIVGGGGEAGALEAMSARDMDLTYADEGERLQQALLAGSASIQITGDRKGRGKRIAGEFMDIALAPDGSTVTSLVCRDNVQVELPPEGDAPGRLVKASSLQATGTPTTGITTAAFSDNVEFRESKTASSGARVARARAMSLALWPGFGAVDSARFSGGVRFEDGDLTAEARDARYLVAEGKLDLEGNDERTGRLPQVVDQKAVITGTRIEVALEGRRIVARGAVNSVLQPAPQSPTRIGPEAAGSADHLPALFKQDQPAYVTAGDLAYDGGTGRAVYTGSVRLWQGETTINGDQVVLDDSKGDLTATGSVRTHLVLLRVNEKTAMKEKVPTIGSAEQFVYADATRRALFTKGLSRQAHVSGGEGDLTADQIEVFLAKTGDELERLEADGATIIRMPEGRTATGAHLTYTAGDERYVMRGTPVQIDEECRVTTGRTLTFFRSTDRIVADGNQERRTQFKSGGKCSEPRLD